MKDRTKPTEVILLSPPYDFPPRPSIALGIFSACLKEAGILSQTLYPMFAMTEKMGIERAKEFYVLPPQAMFEEYLFSHLTGLRQGDNIDAYVEFVCALQRQRKPRQLWHEPAVLKQWIQELRQIAEEVVEETSQKIAAIHPDVLAVSSVFFQLNGALAIARRVKELAPQIKILFGGPNCMGEPGGAILRYAPAVDAVFFGEGDEVFAETIRALQSGAPLPYGALRKQDLAPGMKKAGDFPYRITRDMDSVPTPDYGGFYEAMASMDEDLRKELFFSFYGKKGSPTLLIEGSRGCWWGEIKPCTFCGLNGMKNVYRRRSPQRIFEELLTQAKRFHCDRFEFTDNAFPTQAIKELLPRMEEASVDFRVFAEVKPIFTEADIFAFSRAGFRVLQAGLETMDEHLLTLLNKGGSVVRNIAFLKYCEHARIQVFWNLLLRIPGEQREDYERMLALFPLLFHLPPPTGYSEINYERRGAYVKEAERFGLQLVPMEGYEYIFGRDEAMIADFAQHYTDTGPEEARIAREHKEVYRQMIAAITKWRTIYDGKDKCHLVMEDQGDLLAVTDTRPCRVMNFCLLKDLARTLMLLCNMPRRFQDLLREVTAMDRGITAEDLTDCIRYLCDSRYMAAIGGWYLTLAILQGEKDGALP